MVTIPTSCRSLFSSPSPATGTERQGGGGSVALSRKGGRYRRCFTSCTHKLNKGRPAVELIAVYAPVVLFSTRYAAQTIQAHAQACTKPTCHKEDGYIGLFCSAISLMPEDLAAFDIFWLSLNFLTLLHKPPQHTCTKSKNKSTHGTPTCTPPTISPLSSLSIRDVFCWVAFA